MVAKQGDRRELPKNELIPMDDHVVMCNQEHVEFQNVRVAEMVIPKQVNIIRSALDHKLNAANQPSAPPGQPICSKVIHLDPGHDHDPKGRGPCRLRGPRKCSAKKRTVKVVV